MSYLGEGRSKWRTVKRHVSDRAVKSLVFGNDDVNCMMTDKGVDQPLVTNQLSLRKQVGSE